MDKIMYTTKVTNVGGRDGEVYNDDRSFALKIAPPGSDAAGATNPEQLFAAGYSACFNGALSLLLRRERVQGASTVSVTVTLTEKAPFDYLLSAAVEGHIDGLSAEETLDMLHKAHKVCPYSKATEGNIEVTIKAI